MAMILAEAALLSQMAQDEAQDGWASDTRGLPRNGVRRDTRTADLNGHASTSEFTDAVIERVVAKLDAWSALGDV